MATSASSTVGALTLTLEALPPSSLQPVVPPPRSANRETLILHLRRPKKVTWKEGTVDNEFLGRKSSKKCCIFHKEKSFDDDDRDDDCDGDHGSPESGSAGPSGSCSHGEGHLSL